MGFVPIINYQERSESAEKDLLSNPSISNDNKELLKDYFTQYTVRPATKLKFCKHVHFILSKLPSFKIQMQDRKLVNETFQNLRKNLSPGYVGTVVNVSKALARWANDGELPKGFKDVKSVSRKDQRRDLDPSDMWSWEDGKLCAQHTNSAQLKAIITTQLDAGMRPSEFIDLNYGDVSIKDNIALINVKDGKTGGRVVPCQRCVPFLTQWLEGHPSKKRADPLWTMEFLQKSHRRDKSPVGKVRRYDYWALKKRVSSIASKAKIDKPDDFYNLRHSSCALDKKDNVPVEVAADRHGHTVEYFTSVYGRLNVDEIAERLRTHYAGKAEKVCETCGHVNSKGLDSCEKCREPLTVKKALELKRKKEEDLEFMQEQLRRLDSTVAALQKAQEPGVNSVSSRGFTIHKNRKGTIDEHGLDKW